MARKLTQEEIDASNRLDEAFAGKDMQYICDWIHDYTRSRSLRNAQDRRRIGFDSIKFNYYQQCYILGDMESIAQDMVDTSVAQSKSAYFKTQQLRGGNV